MKKIPTVTLSTMAGEMSKSIEAEQGGLLVDREHPPAPPKEPAYWSRIYERAIVREHPSKRPPYALTTQEPTRLLDPRATDFLPISFTDAEIDAILDDTGPSEKNKFSEFFLKLADIAKALRDPESRRVIEQVEGVDADTPYCTSFDLHIIQLFKPEIFEQEHALRELVIAARMVPGFHRFHDETITKESLTFDDFERGWPPELLVSLRQDLTLAERIQLAHSLRMQEKTRLSANVRDFLIEHYSEFTMDLFRSFSQFPYKLKGSSQRTEFLNLFSGPEVHDALNKLGEREPVIILDHWRRYSSCAATEGRLEKELEFGRAAVIRYEFSDGSNATLAVKYEEVTLAVCMQSTSPLFVERMVYTPAGETVKRLDQLPRGESTLVNITSANDRPMDLWGRNRLVKIQDEMWQQLQGMASKYPR